MAGEQSLLHQGMTSLTSFITLQLPHYFPFSLWFIFRKWERVIICVTGVNPSSWNKGYICSRTDSAFHISFDTHCSLITDILMRGSIDISVTLKKSTSEMRLFVCSCVCTHTYICVMRQWMVQHDKSLLFQMSLPSALLLKLAPLTASCIHLCNRGRETKEQGATWTFISIQFLY